MTVDELIDAAQKERGQRRYEEALRLANAAVEQGPNRANAWWQLALTKDYLDDPAGAAAAYRKTIELSPAFAYGWTCHGRVLWRLDEDTKAREALERALELDPDEDDALTILADLYDKKGEKENQFKVLDRLALMKKVPARFFTVLGNFYYDRKSFFDAIDYYEKAVGRSDGYAPLFNLGLVYSSPDISQEADAVDVWRLTAKRFPDFERSTTELKQILPRVVDRSLRAQGRGPFITRAQWFQHYLNPYELMGVSRD